MIPIDTSNIKEADTIRCILVSFGCYATSDIDSVIETERRDLDRNWLSIVTELETFLSLMPSQAFPLSPLIPSRHWPSTSHASCFHTRLNYEENTSENIFSIDFLRSLFFFFGWDNLRAVPSSSTSGRHWQNVKAILGKNVEPSKKYFLNLSFILCVWKFPLPLFAWGFPSFSVHSVGSGWIKWWRESWGASEREKKKRKAKGFCDAAAIQVYLSPLRYSIGLYEPLWCEEGKRQTQKMIRITSTPVSEMTLDKPLLRKRESENEWEQRGRHKGGEWNVRWGWWRRLIKF